MSTETLSVKLTERNNVIQIQLVGRLNEITAESFIQTLPAKLSNQKVTINCKQLREVDGTGLIALSRLIVHCRKENSSIRFNLLNGQPKAMIDHFQLNGLLCKDCIRKNKNLRFNIGRLLFN